MRRVGAAATGVGVSEEFEVVEVREMEGDMARRLVPAREGRVEVVLAAVFVLLYSMPKLWSVALAAVFVLLYSMPKLWSVALAAVFVLVNSMPKLGSVSLMPLALSATFFSSRRAFLAALSRTPGHAAGTFISHLEWQA